LIEAGFRLSTASKMGAGARALILP